MFILCDYHDNLIANVIIFIKAFIYCGICLSLMIVTSRTALSILTIALFAYWMSLQVSLGYIYQLLKPNQGSMGYRCLRLWEKHCLMSVWDKRKMVSIKLSLMAILALSFPTGLMECYPHTTLTELLSELNKITISQKVNFLRDETESLCFYRISRFTISGSVCKAQNLDL